MPASGRALTVEELRSRPTVTIREAAAFVGVSADTLYEAAARGEAPFLILTVGRRKLVATRSLMQAVGLSEE